MNSAQDLIELLRQKGDLAYDGEGISQLEHAWQCGQLARNAGATPALQLASWLHDIGHLMSPLQGTPTLNGLDDLHETLGADILHSVWGPDVSEPVRLHVQAKRYLVATAPAYLQKLSPDSLRSLALQGGPMSTHECADFESNRFANDAQRLRAWDDLGKRQGWLDGGPQAALDELRTLMEVVSDTSHGV
jgi:phosphonate degradation associated HDIG domain protein